MRRTLPIAGLLIAGVLLLGAKGCNYSCADLTKALEAAKQSGNAEAIAAAGWALAEAGCEIEAPPPATCPDGLPAPAGGCPATCADLACQYGCTEVPSGAVCLPAPDPDPSPICQAGDSCGCWVRPPGEAWQQLPPCPPDPPPPGPEPTACTIPLTGVPVLGAYWHMDRVVDFTPKLTSAARCALPEVGYPGRQTCPACDEECAQRGVCERDLMGGPRPVWRCQSETLRCYDEDGWKVRVAGDGVGSLHASYPNGRASVTLALNCTAKGCRP